MIKKIRKSVADAISNVSEAEQFQWNKWLKEPQIYLERFPKPRIDIKKVESFKTFPEPTLFQVKKFALTKFKVSEDIKNVVIKKKKTFKIFFFFSKTYHQRIAIFPPDTVQLLFLLSFFYKDNEPFVRVKKDNKESINSLLPKTITKKFAPIKVSVKKHTTDFPKVDSFPYDCLVSKPTLLDYKISLPPALTTDKIKNLNVLKYNSNNKYLAIAFNKLDKKPKLKNISVVALDELKEQLGKPGFKKILALPIEMLDKKPKQYRVKLVPLDNLRVSLYHLKNLDTKEANIKTVECNFLEKTALKAENLFHEPLPKLKISNLGILSQLIPAEIDKPKKEVHIEEPKKKIQKARDKKEIVVTKTSKVEKVVETKAKKINLEELTVNIKNLLPHQQEGIKLLLNSKSAMLSDELGIDKKTQVIHALSEAIKQGVIKKALIVCPDSHIGNKKVCEQVKNSEGWENQIYELDPTLCFTTIKANGENKPESVKDAKIFITNYSTLIDLSNDSTKERFTKNIECLILDEAQHLIDNQVQSEQLFNFPQSKYRWVLTSLPSQIIEERLIPKLKNHLVGFEELDGSLCRTKQSLGSELPSIVRNNFWYDLDLEQAQEYENTILQGRKRINDLIKGGNPFIIQSNIFTLIHQIKQLGNFSTHKETSPKSELLLDQIESIIASGQKSIIFSQYDKQGIQKIEKLLKNNQIRYVLYQSGMPLKELENSANSFKKESKISVMLAGLTAASVKVKIPDAPYLIHFDQWWNPITQWQYEDRTFNPDDLNRSSESVNIINYFGNNLVEVNIRETLQRKGLLTKNLLEFLSNETIYNLITNEDWLDILGIDHIRSFKNRKPDIDDLLNNLSETSLEEIGQKTKAFFTKLGYKNLMLKPDMLHEELAIYGIANKRLHEIKTAILCLPFKTKDAEPIEVFIKEASKHNSRIFIICSEEIVQQASNDLCEKVIYIGQRMFANYLAEFKIG